MDEENATNLFSAVSSDQRLARPRMDVPNVQRLSIADGRGDDLLGFFPAQGQDPLSRGQAQPGGT
jgi:hypothetical protein